MSDREPVVMEPSEPTERSGLIEVACVFLTLQGAILIAATIEALVVAAVVGPSGSASIALTGAAAALALVCAWGLGRHRRRARRLVLVGEAGVLAIGLVDVALTLIVGGVGLGLVMILTRIVVPLVVIGLLRRPTARGAFLAGGVA